MLLNLFVAFFQKIIANEKRLKIIFLAVTKTFITSFQNYKREIISSSGNES